MIDEYNFFFTFLFGYSKLLLNRLNKKSFEIVK